MRTLTAVGLAMAMCVALPLLARAQGVSGVVREEGTAAPVPGALVVASTGGTVIARVVSDREGRFSLPLAAMGAAIDVRRIGYRPFVGTIPQDTVVRVSLRPLPRQLEPVGVFDTRCPRRRSEGEARALWEQARTAFAASRAAREAAPAELVFHRARLEGTEALVRVSSGRETSVALPDEARVQTVRSAGLTQATSTRSWVTGRSPEELSTKGYVEVSGGERVLHGPDVDVLMAESFATSRCFWLSEAPERSGQVGVRFEPFPGRKEVTDIGGTLWMARSPLAPSRLEFTYTGEGFADGRSGGFVSFATAANGVTMVVEWSLQHPRDAQGFVTSAPYVDRPSDGVSVTRYAAPGVVEQRNRTVDVGSLISATWRDGTRLAPVLPSIRGVVGRTPADRASVVLSVHATGYRASPGSDGRFIFAPLADGRYRVTAADTLWTRYGVPRMVFVDTEASRDTTRDPIQLRLPDPLAAMETTCRASTLDRGDGMIAFRYVDSAARPVQAIGRVRWIDSRGGRSIEKPFAPAGAETLCGLGAGTLVIQANDLSGRSAEVRFPTSGRKQLDTISVVLRPRG